MRWVIPVLAIVGAVVAFRYVRGVGRGFIARGDGSAVPTLAVGGCCGPETQGCSCG